MLLKKHLQDYLKVWAGTGYAQNNLYKHLSFGVPILLQKNKYLNPI